MFSLIIEETLFGEIAKWVVMGVVVLGVIAGLVYWPLCVYLSRKKHNKKSKKEYSSQQE